MAFDFERLLNRELRQATVEKFKEIGFRYISLDLLGFRSGSLNEVIQKSS